MNINDQILLKIDYKVFLYKIEELKPFIIEFDKYSVIKSKIFLLNCIVKDNNW